MFATIRDSKGQGNAAIYVRVRDATGRFWDFISSQWVPVEVATCRVFLVEYSDSSPDESRYQASVAFPVGGVVLEYVQAVTSDVIADEPGTAPTASLSGGGQNLVVVKVTDGTNPVPGVQVQAWDDASLTALGVTVEDGSVALALADGTYRIICSKPTFGSFPTTSVTVDGPETVSVVGVAVGMPTPPTDPAMCTVYEYLRNPNGSAAAGALGRVKIIALPYDYGGALYSGTTLEADSGLDGYISFVLPRGATVQAVLPGFGVIPAGKVPDRGSARVMDLE